MSQSLRDFIDKSKSAIKAFFDFLKTFKVEKKVDGFTVYSTKNKGEVVSEISETIFDD